jgi:phage tail-like protein
MIAVTSPAELLPPIPQPPHDPTWWLLDPVAGWRAARLDSVEQAPAGGALTLVAAPGSGRSMDEPSGSFGGLGPPANVAIAPTGELYLLDGRGPALRRFDPCRCRFELVPGVGGVGAGPRQLRSPGGIAVHGHSLFVCDTGNRRVNVFTLPSLALRDAWAPPASAGLANPWTPTAIAVDRRGRAFVTDPANGCLHRFAPSGSWQRCLPGLGAPTAVAIDLAGRLYVRVGPGPVRVLDPDGGQVEQLSRPDAAADRFCALPFEVDRAGRLHLGRLCVEPRPAAAAVFDGTGEPTGADPDPPAFAAAGRYLSEPLDSEISACQWHRIILDGRLPIGTRATVATHTSEVREPPEHLDALPAEAWRTTPTAAGLEGGSWDCLVRSDPGRFLWLRLELAGDGAAAPTIDRVRVEFPRLSLRRYLPAVFAADQVSTEFTDRFLSLFDTILRSVERLVDTQAGLFDPDAAPAGPDQPDFLSFLATWVGATADPHLPEARRRRLLKHAARLYHLRGTREGLRRQLLLYLGLDSEAPAGQAPTLILEHYQLRRWLFLGAGRLGDQAELWGRRIVNRSQLGEGAQAGGSQLITTTDPHRDPFHVQAHRFSVFVPAAAARSDRRRRGLERLIDSERPAHTQADVVYVEPRLQVGVQSSIGLDAVIGRYPEGVTVASSRLGTGSILGSSPGDRNEPWPEVGTTARIGTTTKLE